MYHIQVGPVCVYTVHRATGELNPSTNYLIRVYSRDLRSAICITWHPRSQPTPPPGQMPVKSRKRGAELRISQSDSEDEGSMGENCIPTGADSDHPDSDMELDKDDLEVASIIDPTYVNDIKSELQDQGIGVAGDAFSTQVQILGHSLRNGKLTLKVSLGDCMVPVDADWTDIRDDVPATLASNILRELRDVSMGKRVHA
jgi:hypothetical protein